MNNHHSYSRRLYRDSENSVILGVCAGLAWHLDAPRLLVRICALALAWFFPVSTVVAYCIAAFLMPPRPLSYLGDGNERSFWQSHRHGGSR
ncbi:MAG TPA: PspC domain-containing protein [Rhodanobacteraceae bacterium]